MFPASRFSCSESCHVEANPEHSLVLLPSFDSTWSLLMNVIMRLT